MFTTITAQMVLDVVDIFFAFFQHDTREEHILYLLNTTGRIFQAKHYAIIFMLVLGDAFMVRILGLEICPPV